MNPATMPTSELIALSYDTDDPLSEAAYDELNERAIAAAEEDQDYDDDDDHHAGRTLGVRCPLCGDNAVVPYDLIPGTVEITGGVHLNRTALSYSAVGHTDVNWNGQVTVGLNCQHCLHVFSPPGWSLRAQLMQRWDNTHDYREENRADYFDKVDDILGDLRALGVPVNLNLGALR